MKNASNNGYTRCKNCSNIYESSLKKCPKCGEHNDGNTLTLDEKYLSNSNMCNEPVFNLLD